MPNKLHTPDHVNWGQITNNPNKAWPRSWRPIGHPYPIPGGALIMVKTNSRVAHRDVTTIMSWAFDGTVDIVKIGDDPAMYVKTQQARETIVVIAQRLRESVNGADSE